MPRVSTVGPAPFYWTGNAVESNWSLGHNWEGGAAPSSSEAIALEFPRIPGCLGACYQSENDLSGLTSESLKIDDGDEYLLAGHEITLGGGGLTAAPAAGSSGPAGDLLALPFTLAASQTWSIAGRSGGGLGENGAAVFESIGGASSALTFAISNEVVLYLGNEPRSGPSRSAARTRTRPRSSTAT